MDNRHHEAQNEWQLITDYWIELTLKKYEGFDIGDLTQVFMRGLYDVRSRYGIRRGLLRIELQ